ncbi:MAG TPA: demethoxyubiquinone hydroxylase family protein [Candidatus Methylomirabilis sp.]|nr:demethoxyubiquinone hydroxylase family protein [Candidatus Methylomirabilis sp.]
MAGDWRDEAQVPLLLRVGLGAAWVYEGLVPHLLGRSPGSLALFGRGSALLWGDGNLPLAIDGFKVLLGLCLLFGWVIPWAAALQCGLLIVSTAGIAVAAPHLLVYPTGAISKALVLFAAGLCLGILGGGESAGAVRLVPLLLRVGLGLMWLYEGLVPKWFWPSPAEVEIVARTGLIPFHIPLFLRLLGVVESAVGLTVLAGLWTRGTAVLQVGLLGAFTAIVGWTSVAYLADPLGTLSRNLALVGSALALYHTGSGPVSLDRWLAGSATWQRWLLQTALQGNRALAIGAAEAYRVHSQAATDPLTQELFQKLALDEVHRGEDLGSLVRRHGGRPLPVGALCKGVAWILGCATAVSGTRVSLSFDLWLEERRGSLYARCARLLPPEEGITARALQAMQNQEALHVRLLRDHLRARRAAGRTRR